MARSGTSVGTVIRWDDERHGGVVELPELQSDCWVDAELVVHSTGGEGLRAGQVVELEWTESEGGEHPFRAVRVSPRPDLQTTLGG